MAESLLTQNRWLRDPKTRKKVLRTAAASSSAVEGIYKPYAINKKAGRPMAEGKSAKSGR